MAFFLGGPCIGHIWALYGYRGAIYGPSLPGTRPVISGAGRFWPVLYGFEPKRSDLTPPNTRRGPG